MASRATSLDGGKPITGRFVLLCFVAFFGVIFTANFFLVRSALTSFGGVETESAYQAGLQFRQESEAAAAQAARHWQVSAHIGEGRVEVSAQDAAGQPVTGAEALVRFHHPTDRRFDVALDPASVGAGRWRADEHVPPGQWDLVIELNRDGERLFRSTNRVIVR